MDGDDDRAVAAAELHRRLGDALARTRKTKAQLAGLAGLARSTVQEAFRAGAVPSAETTAALARELGLDQAVLLDLRRRAAGPAARPAGAEARDAGVGRPIGAWHPHDLEVHPAGTSGRDDGVLPAYVERAHDRVLAEAVHSVAAGRSAMAVLVGSSSTGKTRACWEAVQPLANAGWRLWHPYDPTRADAALADLARVRPRTVVWLNEAQHFLGDPRVGEQVAAAVHHLLTDEGRGPVLVLGTLWPEYAREYTRLPVPGGPDPHTRARELLAGRTVAVPDTFDDDALRAAAVLAAVGDRHLAGTLSRARSSGRIAQDLAGVPELLRRYREGTAPEQALLRAAMDARRFGMGLHLPWAFLVNAASGYLDDDAWDALADDWAETALDELSRPGHGAHAPLRRPRRRPFAAPAAPISPAVPATTAQGPVYRLADYLEQHGRHERRYTCPPATFWETAAHTATPDELPTLAREAHDRGRYRHATLLRRAADAGDTAALSAPARMGQEAGDQDATERLAQQAADVGDLEVLAWMRERAGDRDGAERLARQAADAGRTGALVVLAGMRERAGDQDGAERLARQAADIGSPLVLRELAGMRERSGDRDGAERLARHAADIGDRNTLRDLARLREEAGDRGGAERLARQAADAGDPYALHELALMREEAGDLADAERLTRQANDVGGDPFVRDWLVSSRKFTWLRGLDWDLDPAVQLARQDGDASGHVTMLRDSAWVREEAGDRDGAERLYRQAADIGSPAAVQALARMREEAGDRDGAERLYRQAADAGDDTAVRDLARITATDQWPAREILRYGWEPDGSFSPPW